MQSSVLKKPTFERGKIKASVINAAENSLVAQSRLQEGSSFPCVFSPTLHGVDLVAWVEAEKTEVEQALSKYGAVLFRGFDVTSAEYFQRVATVLGEKPLTFEENIFPRREKDKNSQRAGTVFPNQLKLRWHNENSFDEARWTKKIMFYSHVPAQEGGQTPICDCRRMFQEIDPAVRSRFQQKGIAYVTNYYPGFGLSWQKQFNASNHDEVEAYCRKWHIECEWLEGDRLRTICRRPAIIHHPVTNEPLWFNVAQMWHISNQAPDILNAWQGSFAPQDYPANCLFGDGTPISVEEMQAIHRAYEKLETIFDWQRGDILVLDNLMVTHGRNPFTGPRELYVAMDKAFTLHEISPEDLLATEIEADADQYSSSLFV